MNRNLLNYIIGFIALLMIFSCKKDNETVAEGSLIISFENMMNGNPLQLNSTVKYINPHGDDFRIEKFRYYISNIVLKNSVTNDSFIEANSYHLITPDQKSNIKTIEIHSIPNGIYDEVEFSIGIDSEKNTSLDNSGDLDPNNNMAWDWNTGYKFLLLEGKYFTNLTGSNGGGLVFHIGENKNYKKLTFKLRELGLTTINFASSAQKTLKVTVAIEEMWKTPTLINFDDTHEAMFGADAQTISNNYADGMFSIKSIE